ncbi:MAG: ribosome recycling factor [Clostridia bacterium]|nr:ribosome recycling factor [Clostridia bacterium]
MKELLKNTEEKMNKTVGVLEREYKSIRAGRANIAVLDRITVDYYGCPTPIQQMAAVSVPEPRILMIQPWDATTLKEIEKAILTSDIGINPQNDGRVIRLSFPPLTEERRKEIVKEVRKTAEDNKVAIRNTRRDAIEKLKALKKANTITEDDVADGEKKIQNLTDKFCKEIDDLASSKEKEIMEI